MERIIYDIPMDRYIKEYFDKCLVHSLAIGEYPQPNSFKNNIVVIQWIVELQKQFNLLFGQSIYQTNTETIHFELRIIDSKQIEHKFDVKLNVGHTIRRTKLNKIKNNIKL